MENEENAEDRPWTRNDEENLLLEISEDRRLARLGIDPDANPLEITLQLKERLRQIQSQSAPSIIERPPR
jgi:hypothetical protein